MDPGKAHNPGFDWPPSATVAPPAAVIEPKPATPLATNNPRPTALGEIECILLGVEQGPIQRQIHDLRWTPQPTAARCRRCGTPVGPGEETDQGCRNCHEARQPWTRVTTLGPYQGPLGAWVQALKFSKDRKAGAHLGKLLGQRLADLGIHQHAAMHSAGDPSQGGCVVAMPTAWRRRVARGIDAPAVLARALAQQLGWPLLTPLRRTHRPSQRSVPHSQRSNNVRGSITLRSPVAAHRLVVLVDDVMTTGATMREAALALTDRESLARRHGPRGAAAVWAAPLSIADP